MTYTRVKWAAELEHVREVSLLGTADLTFWKDRLLNENLLPAASEDGDAQLLIVAAELTFMGVRFRELSFSVVVARRRQANQQDATYLLGAFNSSRALAWSERVFFATPYVHGDVRVSASLPASLHLAKQGNVLFGAEMRANATGQRRAPSHHGEQGWEGPVFLPNPQRGAGRQDHVFFARIGGHAQTYPFLPDQDSLTLSTAPDSHVLQALLESHFVAKEWIVRENATHAKSKTYTRSEAFLEVIT